MGKINIGLYIIWIIIALNTLLAWVCAMLAYTYSVTIMETCDAIDDFTQNELSF